MSDTADLIRRLEACPTGHAGWVEFENICVEILVYLFVPPLNEPIVQPRTYSGIDRRDAVFPNRNKDADSIWGQLYQELGARLVLFEFKNYDATDIGKDEINQTRNYLTKAMGRLAVVCCNKIPNEAAHIKRNSIYAEEQKVIIFVTPDLLVEMISIKERGDDPSDLIMDLVERFYLQHE